MHIHLSKAHGVYVHCKYHSLVLCAVKCQLFHYPACVIYIKEAVTPQCQVYLHGVLAHKCLMSGVLIMKICVYYIKLFFLYTVDLALFICHKSRPCSNSPCDRGIPQQLIVLDHTKQCHEGLCGSVVHVLAYCLAESLLEPCCHQQLTKGLV